MGNARKRDRNETVGPRVGCSPNSSTCPRDASNISRYRRGSRVPNFWPVPGRVMIATWSAGPRQEVPYEWFHVACTWPRKQSGVPQRKFLSRRKKKRVLSRARRSYVIRLLGDSMVSPLMREIAAQWNAVSHVNRAYFRQARVTVTVI